MGLLFNKNFGKKTPVKFADLDPVYRAQAVIAVGNCSMWQEMEDLLKEGKVEEAQALTRSAIAKNFAMLFGFARHHDLQTEDLFHEVIEHINKEQEGRGVEAAQAAADTKKVIEQLLEMDGEEDEHND